MKTPFNILSQISSIWWDPKKLEKQKIGKNPPQAFSLINKYLYEVCWSGRGIQKSTKNAIKIWLLMRTFKKVDVICVVDQFKSVKDSVISVLHNAAQFIGLPKQKYRIHVTANLVTVEYYHWTKLGAKITNNILFYNSEGGGDSFRGREPTPGNKIIAIWLFEFGKLDWDLQDINIMFNSYVRSMLYVDKTTFVPCAKDNPNAMNLCRVLIEFNTPPPGSRYKAKLDTCIAYWRDAPDVDFHFGNYQLYEDHEIKKYLGPETINQIEYLKKYAHKIWENEWCGLEGYSGDQIFYNIEQRHFGAHNFDDVQWTDCRVGIDYGRHAGTAIVASLFGINLSTGRPVMQMGYKAWFHCNYKAEHWEWNWDTHTTDKAMISFRKRDLMKDYATWILKFLDQLENEMRKFKIPKQKIEVRLDWQSEGSALWERCAEIDPKFLQYRTYKQWEKAETQSRIDFFLIAFADPDFLKCHNPKILEAMRNLKYNKHHEIHDKLEDLSQNNDLWDANSYTFSEEEARRLISILTHGIKT